MSTQGHWGGPSRGRHSNAPPGGGGTSASSSSSSSSSSTSSTSRPDWGIVAQQPEKFGRSSMPRDFQSSSSSGDSPRTQRRKRSLSDAARKPAFTAHLSERSFPVTRTARANPEPRYSSTVRTGLPHWERGQASSFASDHQPLFCAPPPLALSLWLMP